MKNFSLFLLIILIVTGCDNNRGTTESESSDNNEMKETPQLRHVVMLKFKESSTPADIQEVEAAFLGLPSKIKEIKDLEWGLNNSPEGLNKGFTHCFFLTFDSEEERAIYLPHPAHKAFGKVLGPHLEDVMVLDYWAK